MKIPIRTVLMLIALVASGLLAACGAGPTPTAAPAVTQTQAPTADLNALRTEVAATVLAQIPQILAQTPSPTVAATATQTRAAETPTITATQPTVTPGAGTPTTELTDKAQWISQSVADGTEFQPGADFTMTWQVKNVGNSTWTAGYRLRFFANESFGTPKEIELGKEVRPGETVDITVQMKAPKIPGKYRGDWVLSNEARGNFKDALYLEIVVPAPTATPTKTLVPTSTATPKPEPSATPTK